MPDDSNPFEEFFRALSDGLNHQPSEEQLLAEMDHSAKISWWLFSAYLRNGFTVEQSFELTKLQLNSATHDKKDK